MINKLTQPKVAHYLDCLRHNNYFGQYSYAYDDKSNKLLDELFGLLERVSPVAENASKTLWLRAERGHIDDYGDAEEEIADGTFETEEDRMVSAFRYSIKR